MAVYSFQTRGGPESCANVPTRFAMLERYVSAPVVLGACVPSFRREIAP